MEKVTGQVRCSGKMHKITINDRGPIILHNHTRAELVAERVLVALGGEPCRCMQFLQAWRSRSYASASGPIGYLPPWSHEIFKQAEPIGYSRYQLRSFASYDLPLEDRIRWNIRGLIMASLKTCSYRRKLEKSNPPSLEFYCSIYPLKTDDISAQIYKRKGSTGWVDITVNLYRWHNHIYKHGLAVVDGCFVRIYCLKMKQVIWYSLAARIKIAQSKR